MRPAILAVLAALAAWSSACHGRACDEGEVQPCTCAASGRGGRARCTPDGDGFGACDCSADACPRDASETCRAGELHRLDACGNLDPVPSEQCTCGCVEGAASCGAWDPPATMTIPAACQDATACLVREPLPCVQVPDADGWVYGFRLVNVCDQPIRCYAYAETSDAHETQGGVWREGSTWCLAPPGWPTIAPAEPIVSREEGFDSEGECRARYIERPNRHELHYAACVLESDPAETCLPDIDWGGDPLCPSLAPACRPG